MAVNCELLLEARSVARRFGRRRVLDGVHLELRAGEAIGICGENGSGKTTVVRILAGVLRPDRGEVRRLAAIGYAPQVPLLYDHLTPWEHFRYFAAARAIPDGTWQARARMLLDLYRFQAWHGERAAALSEGTRQKLNVALALLSEPRVLLLDEPYAGFEWHTYLRFWEHVDALRAEGRAVLIVSHLFYERGRLGRVLELRDGRMAEAT